MKRFYVKAEAGPIEAGSGVLLDGKPLKTPQGHPLAMPFDGLAEAVAAEWAAQGDELAPATMPLTRMATTATDLMPARREDVVAEAAGYAGSDLVCYRAIEPAALVERQARTWQPLLDWAKARYGAMLRPVAGVVPMAQPEPAVQALHAAVDAEPDWPLVGLHAATTALGSLVLGLALAERRIDAAAAFDAGLLDENWTIERWGEDDIAMRRRTALRRDIEAAARFLSLTRVSRA